MHHLTVSDIKVRTGPDCCGLSVLKKEGRKEGIDGEMIIERISRTRKNDLFSHFSFFFFFFFFSIVGVSI